MTPHVQLFRKNPTCLFVGLFSDYLTRAVSSPTSDPGKGVLPAACLLAASCLLTAGLLWSPREVACDNIFIFWQKNCEQSARPSMPIRIPSQTAVDCKSVHLVWPVSYALCIIGGLIVKCCHLSRWQVSS